MPGYKIIVLDDDPGVRAIICEIAQSCGLSAFGTGDPVLFEARLQEDRPHAVVLDMVMPGLDGVEILRELASRLIDIPILIASGMDDRLLDTAMQLGRARGLTMAGVIRKPFRAEALRKILQNVVATSGVISERMLSDAIDRNELDLHYQPYMELSSHRIVGAEALVRWEHPVRGTILPVDFIPMAEKSALIGKVTDVVLAKAIAQAGEWAERGGDIKVSINLSARSIYDINFPDQVRQLCARHGIEPDQITFEITETAAMHDAVMMMDVLARLRLKGFRLSIDDFGTGYSSLAQLQRLPFSELKIDLLFISTMATSRESEIIVKTIIDMAHNLGLRTVAEGVENSATLNRLRELGCNLAQGYFIGRPMPARQMAPFLAAHQVFHYPGAARDLVTQRSL